MHAAQGGGETGVVGVVDLAGGDVGGAGICGLGGAREIHGRVLRVGGGGDGADDAVVEGGGGAACYGYYWHLWLCFPIVDFVVVFFFPLV